MGHIPKLIFGPVHKFPLPDSFNFKQFLIQRQKAFIMGFWAFFNPKCPLKEWLGLKIDKYLVVIGFKMQKYYIINIFMYCF